MSHERLYIGLDAGGSKTECLAQSSLKALPLSKSGPAANLQRQGVIDTARVLAMLVGSVVEEHPGASLQAVCAGVAGAGSLADQQTLKTHLQKMLSALTPIHLQVVHDAAVALEGAFEGGSGTIVIAGTGSMIYARTLSGDTLRAGGWGYLLGDEGSGYALGLHGLRAVAAAFDGDSSTYLSTLLSEQFAIDTPEALKRSVYREEWPVQQMAPLVLEAAAQGDDETQRIVLEQTRALARQVEQLMHQTEALEPRLALLGGLTRSPYYKQALTDAILTLLPTWNIQEPAQPPVAGALRLALASNDSG